MKIIFILNLFLTISISLGNVKHWIITPKYEKTAEGVIIVPEYRLPLEIKIGAVNVNHVMVKDNRGVWIKCPAIQVDPKTVIFTYKRIVDFEFNELAMVHQIKFTKGKIEGYSILEQVMTKWSGIEKRTK